MNKAQRSTERRVRRAYRVLWLLLFLVAVWFLGDFIYSLVITNRLSQWESSIQRDRDGIQADCREYTIGAGSHAVLLVHGINDSPLCYRKMAPRLAVQGFTCRVMRLPGFGEPMDRFSNVTAGQWIHAVETEVNLLSNAHDRVSIVAHSLGGAVTIAFLLDHPGAVESVVLLAPAVEVANHRSPLLSTRAWHEIGKRTLFLTRVTQSPFENDATDPNERDWPGRLVFSPRSVFDETFLLIDGNRGRARELTTPLLMMLSKKDQVVDWRAAQEFYKQAGSAEKQLHIASDSAHAIPVDYGWEEITDKIGDFLRLAEGE